MKRFALFGDARPLWRIYGRTPGQDVADISIAAALAGRSPYKSVDSVPRHANVSERTSHCWQHHRTVQLFATFSTEFTWYTCARYTDNLVLLNTTVRRATITRIQVDTLVPRAVKNFPRYKTRGFSMGLEATVSRRLFLHSRSVTSLRIPVLEWCRTFWSSPSLFPLSACTGMQACGTNTRGDAVVYNSRHGALHGNTIICLPHVLVFFLQGLSKEQGVPTAAVSYGARHRRWIEHVALRSALRLTVVCPQNGGSRS